MKPDRSFPTRNSLLSNFPAALRVALVGCLIAGALMVLPAGCSTTGATSRASRVAANHYCPGTRNEALCRSVAAIRGVNLGNALEGPTEGSWGVTLTEDDFRIIAEGGFNTVRVPIRWSAHAAVDAPYTVDETFFQRIDWVLDNARANGLLAIINMHHYDQIFQQPFDHDDRFVAIWQQIAERYADRPDSEVWFEPLNEPNGALSQSIWEPLVARTIDVIRTTNPTRPIVVGGADWNAFRSLFGLDLPDDPNIVLTFHYYLPFEFTHQGAEWQSGMNRYLGTTWEGTVDERGQINRHFDYAMSVAGDMGYPVLLGEFGAYSKAPLESRGRWTEAVARSAEAHGFGWTYWEYRSGFGVYDRSHRDWVEPIYRALLP